MGSVLLDVLMCSSRHWIGLSSPSPGIPVSAAVASFLMARAQDFAAVNHARMDAVHPPHLGLTLKLDERPRSARARERERERARGGRRMEETGKRHESRNACVAERTQIARDT